MRCSDNLNIGYWTTDKVSGFCPSKDAILNFSEQALLNHRLTCVEHATNYSLYRLTFVFNDGSRAPPKKFYDAEPD